MGAASGDAVGNMEVGLRSVLVGEDTAPQVEGDRDPPIEEVDLVCPYCGETVTVALEADLAGELVQDCEVCCNPWRLRLGRSAGRRAVTVERLDD